jgi:electron transfer flavoprotein alpha subunit
MAGMQSAEYIIAINKDPNADIFQIANLGIVGNALEILPALTKAFKEQTGK